MGRLTILLTFCGALLAGCLDDNGSAARETSSATSNTGSTTSVVGMPVIEVMHNVSWTGSPRGGLMEGDHCASTQWNDGELVLDRDPAARPLADALIVRRYDPGDFANGSRLSSRSNGGDLLGAFSRDLAAGVDYDLKRSFAPGLLATMRFDEGALRVDGVLLAADGDHILESTYAVRDGTVTERTTIRLHPDHRVVLEPDPTTSCL